MKKGWSVILTIVLAALLLGAVCIGVGLMTGADSMRIFSTLDGRYHLTAYWQAYTQYAVELFQAVKTAWLSIVV